MTAHVGQPGEPVELPTSDCSICRHPDAAAIDAGLLAGTPLRSLAETHTVSRSALGRHKQNHLTLQTITEPEPVEGREPLRLVDVHAQLAALVDRLEDVVALASRTRKAPAAVAAMRELRQTLEAIARIQADPELQKAASLQVLEEWATQSAVDAWIRMVDFAISKIGGLPFSHTLFDERTNAISQIITGCLHAVEEQGVDARFRDVDTSLAAAFVERQALDRAARIEAEVQRRVEAELRRREAQARPALEARPLLEIEGSTSWTA